MQDSKSLHYVLGAALALIAVFVVVALVMINSQAANTNTQVAIDNVSPTVEAIFLSNDAETGDGGQQVDDYAAGTINSLVSGSTKNLYLTGYVKDMNGSDDITNAEAVLYRTGATNGADCTADKNDCYVDATCDVFDKTGVTDLWYSCGPFAVQYFADSTSAGGAYLSDNWTGRVEVTDGTTTGNTTLAKEMQTLLSLSIPGSIDYGTLALGAVTTDANNQTLTVTQQGNDAADVEVSSATAMACTVRGTIPVASQAWALTDIGFATSTPLTGGATDTALGITYQTDEVTPTTGILYWNVAIPDNNTEGTCTGFMTVSAIAA